MEVTRKIVLPVPFWLPPVASSARYTATLMPMRPSVTAFIRRPPTPVTVRWVARVTR